MASFLGKILGEGVGDVIKDVGDVVNKKIDLVAQSDTEQTQINNTEASNSNLFISGWRPFCGWCCSLALAYHAIFQPFVIFIFALFGKVIDLPEFDTNTLTTTLWGLLGLGTLRTVEKLKK